MLLAVKIVKKKIVDLDLFLVGQMTVGFLLVKLPGLSTFCLSCWCRNKVACDVQQVLAIV